METFCRSAISEMLMSIKESSLFLLWCLWTDDEGSFSRLLMCSSVCGMNMNRHGLITHTPVSLIYTIINDVNCPECKLTVYRFTLGVNRADFSAVSSREHVCKT